MSATDLPVFVTARWAAPGQEKTKVAPDNVALMSPPLTPLRWRSRPVPPKSESGPSTTSFHSKRIWTKTGTMTGPTQGQIVAPARGCARSSSLPAFYECEGLIQAILPPSLTHIGVGAFEGCEGLAQVTFPTGLTHIGEEAFSNCRRRPSLRCG